MPSTYTTNLGIEKIATGEQSGTWGTTTNTNLDLIDEAINGVEQVTLSVAGSSGSPNDLPITNGTSSDGRNKFIEFIDGGDLGGTAFVQLTPNDAEKVVHIRNSLSADRTITIFQGTYNASNDFVIPNGADVVLKFDGAGAGAVVSDVFVNLTPTKLTTAEADVTTGNITTVNATTVDTTNVEVTNLKAKDGTSAGSIADSTGVVTLASSVLTTTDINGGTIDGATIATSDITVGSGKTLDVSAGTLTLANDQISGDKINGGTIGSVTITSLTATSADINGGTIDGVTIGGASAGAVTATTITGSGDMNIDSGTLFVDASANAVGIGTTTPTSPDGSNADNPLNGTVQTIYGPSPAINLIDNDGSDGYSLINFGRTGGSSNPYRAAIGYDQANDKLVLSAFRDILFKDETLDGSERMRIDSGGNVGIGISSPQAKLHVNNSVLVSSADDADVRNYRLDLSNRQQTGGINFVSESPVAFLDLYAGGSAANLGGWYGGIRFFTGGSDQYGSERLRIDSGGDILAKTADARIGSDVGSVEYGTSTANSVRFYTNDAEAMRIDSSGNVGIGTTSPDSNIVAGIDNQSFVVARYDLSGGVPAGGLGGIYAANANAGDFSSGDVVIQSRAGVNARSIKFYTGNNSAERMRIDDSGNLLVGTTSAVDKLTVNGDIYASGGIHLGGTGAANYLDDYEEGTWTPSPISLTTSGTVTYTGTYTKIGRFVFGLLTVSSSGGTTTATADTTRFSGLPFAADSIGGMALSIITSTSAGTAAGQIGGAGTTIVTGGWSAASSVRMSFWYTTT